MAFDISEDDNIVTATAWPFVELDDNGLAYVQGTTTKVIEIALDQMGHDMSADEIRRHYPYLSLAQIHAALGYYHDHREDCDRQIEERERRTSTLLNRLENTELQERLRQLKATQ